MPIVKADPSDAGCWIDGHWGQYATTNLISIAEAHGMRLDPMVEIAIKCHDRDEYGSNGNCSCTEYVMDVAQDAESWLNDNVAPEGYSFGWFDGEFFLWSDETWNEEARY